MYVHSNHWSRRCRRIALLGFLAALLPAAQAGSRIGFAATGECEPELESLKIDGSQFRSDSRVGGQGTSLLYDGVERVMTTLMHDSLQYLQTEVDEDALDYQGDVADSTGNYMNKQMEKMEAQMAQQCAQMRSQGMQCPEMDLRGMMQGMVANQMPTWRDLDRDGESGGIACRWWERAQAGRKVMEECSAKVGALPIGERDRRGLQRGVQVMQRYGGNMMGMMRGLTGEDAPPSGMPSDAVAIAQVCFGADGRESGRVAATFAESEVDAAEFEIPSGYSQMRMTP